MAKNTITRKTGFKPNIKNCKISSKKHPIDEGIDIPIVISDTEIICSKKDKNKHFYKIVFNQKGYSNKVADILIGFNFDSGIQAFIDLLYHTGVYKKLNINFDKELSPEILVKIAETKLKAFEGIELLADVDHYDEKYQGKTLTKANIIQLRSADSNEGEDDFADFDDVDDDDNTETEEELTETVDEEKPKKRKTKKERKVKKEELTNTVVDTEAIKNAYDDGDDENEVWE